MAVSIDDATFESRNNGFPDEQKSMMAAKISGFRKSQEVSSDLVTVIKSDPKNTRVIPAMAIGHGHGLLHCLNQHVFCSYMKL